jgi:hypothetical protein
MDSVSTGHKSYFPGRLEVLCTVVRRCALRAPYLFENPQGCKAVNFMSLAKVCKEMDNFLLQYLRTKGQEEEFARRHSLTSKLLRSGWARWSIRVAQRSDPPAGDVC